MKAFTEIKKISMGRREVCSHTLDPVNPHKICFLAVGATLNTTQRTCWEMALLNFMSPQSLVAAHTQLLLLGVAPDTELGDAKHFSDVYTLKNSHHRVKNNCFHKVNTVHF